jgi:Zn-dependent protease with chaperone function
MERAINCRYFDGQTNTCREIFIDIDFREKNIYETVIPLNGDNIKLSKEDTSYELHGKTLHIHNSNFPINAYITIQDQATISFIRQNFRKKVNTSKKDAKNIYVYSVFYTFILLSLVTLWINISLLVPHLPKSFEQWLEHEASLLLQIDDQIIADHKSNKIIKKIHDLLIVLDPEFKNLKLQVSNDNDINAFAMPNNRIVILKGLIDRADNMDEIMGVLAHELGHIKKKHSISFYIKTVALSFIEQLAFGGNGVGLSYLIIPSNSREYEMEADTLAVEYLNKMNISTSGIVRFFIKIAKENTAKTSKIDHFFASHPLTIKRAEFFKSHDKKYKTSVFKKDDLKKLKQSLRVAQVIKSP